MADSMLVSSKSVIVKLSSITVAPPFSVKARVLLAPVVVGASLTAATLMVEVTAEESASPSFTTQEMVRSVVLGLSDVLL